MLLTVAAWMLRTPEWIEQDRRCLEALDVVRVLAGFGIILFAG